MQHSLRGRFGNGRFNFFSIICREGAGKQGLAKCLRWGITNPGLTAYFGMVSAGQDTTEHMGDLKVKYLWNFASPDWRIFTCVYTQSGPSSNRPKHNAHSGSVHVCALSDSETIFYRWLDLADVFWKLCRMPNTSTLMAGAVLARRRVLQLMQSFVPKQPACGSVAAAQIHLRGAAGRMLSSPVFSIYFTRQMD